MGRRIVLNCVVLILLLAEALPVIGKFIGNLAINTIFMSFV